MQKCHWQMLSCVTPVKKAYKKRDTGLSGLSSGGDATAIGDHSWLCMQWTKPLQFQNCRTKFCSFLLRSYLWGMAPCPDWHWRATSDELMGTQPSTLPAALAAHAPILQWLYMSQIWDQFWGSGGVLNRIMWSQDPVQQALMIRQDCPGTWCCLKCLNPATAVGWVPCTPHPHTLQNPCWSSAVSADLAISAE